MAPALRDLGRGRRPHPRQGARRLPRGARVPCEGGLLTDRIDRLRQSLEEPLLVSSSVNVRYLVGLESSNVALLVEPESERLRLFSDFRYAEAGRAVDGVEFAETKRSLFADLAERLSGRIGFEADDLTYSRYATLAAGGLDLVPRYEHVERLRVVKDEDEQDAVRKATAVTNEAYERLAAQPFVGRTERDVARRMEELFRELGADEPAFPTIVAAGPNSSRPHGRSGAREIERGETVVIDAGAKLDGYCSDCTRTFATGPLPERLEEAYAICLEAQLAGVAAVRAGVSARDADAAARTRIEEAGFGEAFGHGLGHGVGLDVHESPRLARESGDTLADGNVVTIEPGIYLPGLGGIRIEDLAIVRDGEPEVLTGFTKELVRVD
jgi:Xaa-Pro aminopeptidase